jgi:hypothetical protein
MSERPKVRNEDREQIDFVEWFRKTFPEVKILMIRNDGTRTAAEKCQQIAMGLLPGASDLHIPEWDVYLEMKRTKGYKFSPEQIKFKEYIERIGKIYVDGIGFEDAKTKILKIVDELNNNDI